MKVFFYFIITFLISGCNFQRKHRISSLKDVTSLNIPPNITEIQSDFVKPDDYDYPYDFYARFKCDSNEYLLLRRQIDTSEDASKNNKNIYVSSRNLASDVRFLDAYKQLKWWNVRKVIDEKKLYVNYFKDSGNKEKKVIGDSLSFNGMIAIFYKKPYCFLYIGCNRSL